MRKRGLSLEQRLKVDWGGFPTTDLLRFNNHSGDARLLARRVAIEKVTIAVLPGRQLEDADPAEADTEIERIVRLGIARIRETKVESDLLEQENTSYGFRRNLRALKPFGLSAVGISILVAACFVTTHPAIVTTIVAGDLLITLLWLAVVRDGWVHEQAEKYAERFFVAIQTIANMTPTLNS